MGWSYSHLWSDTRFNKDSELRILILECVFHGIRFSLVMIIPAAREDMRGFRAVSIPG